MIGYNSRLDPLRAVVLLLKLERIEQANAARRHTAALYVEGLGDLEPVDLPELTDVPWHVFHQFTLRVVDGRREHLRGHLAERGIASAVYYPTPVYRLPPYAGARGDPLPVTERLRTEVLSLPIWAGMDDGTIRRVVAVSGRFFE